MSGKNDSSGCRPRLDADDKAACLKGLLEGERVRDLAAALGVSTQAFYRARKRDPVFDAGWRAAHAASAAAERVPSAPAQAGETRIAPANQRELQRRKMRHVKFDEKRQQAFLAHFAWSCDAIAAAAEAGICERTAYVHRRNDPAFAEEFQRALEQGYARLEAEAVRQRLVAQQALRAAIDAAEGAESSPVPGDVAAEFERVLKLLARWDRKPRRRDGGAEPGGRVWTFDAAIVLLDKRLNALGMAVPPLPPEIAARYDGAPGDGSGSGEGSEQGDGPA